MCWRERLPDQSSYILIILSVQDFTSEREFIISQLIINGRHSYCLVIANTPQCLPEKPGDLKTREKKEGRILL